MRASQHRWRHYRDALEGQPLPAGLVDLDAFEANVDAVVLVAEPPDGGAPRQVLMEQGIVDGYILPNIANASSLAIPLDLAGTEHDTADDPRLAHQRPLGPLLPLVGRAPIALPASGNVATDGGAVTAVVVQHVEDGVEDGHEVLFQTDGPKHQYQCFLASWLRGTPTVPIDAARDAACPRARSGLSRRGAPRRSRRAGAPCPRRS